MSNMPNRYAGPPPPETLPKLPAYDGTKLDLGIAAFERGVTPEDEFRRRMEEGGAHVVSPIESPPGLAGVIRRFIGGH